MNFSPKVNVEVFCALRKEIGELVANLLCFDEQISISDKGQTYLTFYVWNECTQS